MELFDMRYYYQCHLDITYQQKQYPLLRLSKCSQNTYQDLGTNIFALTVSAPEQFGAPFLDTGHFGATPLSLCAITTEWNDITP